MPASLSSQVQDVQHGQGAETEATPGRDHHDDDLTHDSPRSDPPRCQHARAATRPTKRRPVRGVAPRMRDAEVARVMSATEDLRVEVVDVPRHLGSDDPTAAGARHGQQRTEPCPLTLDDAP